MSRAQLSAAPPPQSPTEILSTDLNFLLLGIFGWEYVQSLDVEFAVICGRSALRAPLIPYVLGRISLLFLLIMRVVQLSPLTSPTAICDPGVFFVGALVAITIGCSSAIFMIRTWVIWKGSHLMHVLQLLLALGQLCLLVSSVAILKVSSVNGICSIRLTHPKVPGISIIYTMCYDFVTFVLSVVGLARQRSDSPLKRRLRAQGVLYFAIAGIVYIPPVIFVFLNNDQALAGLFYNIAMTASTILASRAVRSLLSLNTCTPGDTGESNLALTTQIAVGTMMTQDDSQLA